MEQIREVALAYYAHSSIETKEMAKTFFQNMDADGDGKISVDEFEEYVKGRWRRFKPEFFTQLDQDGDGCLDFEEVLVFYYMVKLRNSFCDGCGDYLNTLYFTCTKCFLKKTSRQTFDLCLACYKTKQFSHEHADFLDNYAMLNSVWSDLKKEGSNEEAMKAAGEGLHLAGQVVELAATCTIL